VIALAVVGSVSRDFVRSPGDMDFLAITNDQFSDQMFLENVVPQTPGEFQPGEWVHEEYQRE
jgi:hypothetical protein